MKIKSKLKAGNAAVTVYGADWCGWTTKQRDNLDAKGIDYEYVNCDNGQCPEVVQGFPTTVINGFKEF